MKLTKNDVNTIQVSIHKNPGDLASELGVAKKWVVEKMSELKEIKRLQRLVR